MSAVLETEVQ